MKCLKIYFFTFFLALISNSFLLAQSVWTEEEMNKANTAKNISYLTDEEKKVIQLMNLARMDGGRFYNTYIPWFIRLNNSTMQKQIEENNRFVKSLKSDLFKVNNLPLLYAEQSLFNAAQYHAHDMGKTGRIGHRSSNGDSFRDRIERFTGVGYEKSENCSYGFDSALGIVCQLLIDRDVEDLGHRKNILRQRNNSVGVAIRPHKQFKVNCVMDFSSVPFKTESFSINASRVWTLGELDRANTARDTPYLNKEEKKVIQLMNLARMDGAKFYDSYIMEFLKLNNLKYQEIKEDNSYLTSLKERLETVRNLPLIRPDEVLYEASLYHALDQKNSGKTGHNSQNGQTFHERMERFTGSSEYKSEIISYGFEVAIGVVGELLLDNNIRSLRHRKEILDFNNQVVGVALRTHKKWGAVCVIDFNGEPVSESDIGFDPSTFWTTEELNKANTARSVTYLNDEEKKVVQLINLARMDGTKFFESYIKAYLIIHNKVYEPFSPENIFVRSLKGDLSKITGMPLLYPDESLSKAAKFHAEDMGKTGLTGHTSSSGESMKSRIERFTGGIKGYAECGDYGFGSAVGIVGDLLVDNGVHDTGNRRSLLNKDFRLLGVKISDHSAMKHVCILDLVTMSN